MHAYRAGGCGAPLAAVILGDALDAGNGLVVLGIGFDLHALVGILGDGCTAAHEQQDGDQAEDFLVIRVHFFIIPV
jgi:hypothetical protein